MSCFLPVAPPTVTSPSPAEFTTVIAGALSPTLTVFPKSSTSVPLNFVVFCLLRHLQRCHPNLLNLQL